MIVVITGVVTVGGVEYPVRTEVDLPEPPMTHDAWGFDFGPEKKEKDNVIRPG